MFHDLLHQAAAQLVEVRVRESCLKGCDQHSSLFENGDFHVALSSGSLSVVPPTSPPCIPTIFRPARCPLAGRPPCSSFRGRHRWSPPSEQSLPRAPGRLPPRPVAGKARRFAPGGATPVS